MAKRQIEVVNVRELARNTGRVLEEVEEGTYVLITRKGRPVATVSPISQEALEDFVLAHAPEFVESLDEADREIASGRTVALREFERELKSKTRSRKQR